MTMVSKAVMLNDRLTGVWFEILIFMSHYVWGMVVEVIYETFLNAVHRDFVP